MAAMYVGHYNDNKRSQHKFSNFMEIWMDAAHMGWAPNLLTWTSNPSWPKSFEWLLIKSTKQIKLSLIHSNQIVQVLLLSLFYHFGLLL